MSKWINLVCKYCGKGYRLKEQHKNGVYADWCGNCEGGVDDIGPQLSEQLYVPNIEVHLDAWRL